MSLNEEDRNTLVKLYLEKAELTWEEFLTATEAQLWPMAANRLYYAVFQAVSALLVHDQHPVRSHLGAKISFGQHYVQTGIASAEEGRLYAQLESLRERADYDCFFKVSEEDVQGFKPAAEALINHIKELLQ